MKTNRKSQGFGVIAAIYVVAMTLVFVGCGNKGGGGGGDAGVPHPAAVAALQNCAGTFTPALTNVRGSALSNGAELVMTQVCGETARLNQTMGYQQQYGYYGSPTVPGMVQPGNMIPFSIYSGQVVVNGTLQVNGALNCGGMTGGYTQAYPTPGYGVPGGTLVAGTYTITTPTPGTAQMGTLAGGMSAGMGMSGMMITLSGPSGTLQAGLSGMFYSQTGGSINLSNQSVRFRGTVQLQNGCSFSLY